MSSPSPGLWVRSNLIALTVLAFAFAAPAFADPASLNIWSTREVDYWSGGDVLNAAAAGGGQSSIDWGLVGGTGGPTVLTSRLSLPEGFIEMWTGDRPSYHYWSQGASMLTFRNVEPAGVGPGEDGWWNGVDLPSTHIPYSGPVTLSRSMADPVLDSDSLVRTVTISLEVEPGGLAGMEFGLSLADWTQIDGLSATVVGRDYDTNVFIAYNNWFGLNVDPSTLAGTYTFELDVWFQRSGPLAQAVVGDLLYKPEVGMNYAANAEWIRSPSPPATSISHSLGDGLTLTIDSSTPAYMSLSSRDRTSLWLQPIVAQAGAAAEPQGIQFLVGSRTSPSGALVHEASVSVEGLNLVGGALTTPGGQMYALGVEEPGRLEFWIESADAADLGEFIAGDYTLVIWGADGVAQTYPLSLAGALPTDEPAINLSLNAIVTDAQPTVTSSTSADPDVNLGHFEIEMTADLFEGGADVDPAVEPMAFTPPTPLSDGGAWVGAYFADITQTLVNAVEGTVLDVPFFGGYYTGLTSMFNVVLSALPGDFNGDGLVNTEDINPFILALTNPDGFGVKYGLNPAAYDLNGDGVINTEDINPFIAALTGAGQGNPIPEPTTVLVLGASVLLCACGRAKRRHSRLPWGEPFTGRGRRCESRRTRARNYRCLSVFIRG